MIHVHLNSTYCPSCKKTVWVIRRKLTHSKVTRIRCGQCKMLIGYEGVEQE